ncbi:glycosyltransferase family 4 protein [Streptomyces sp. NPDC058252]|uniref:glycosyltransferase family 4 protein n=1 Tax=Streptomyces sp. NPDC058252 TaxID=3346405 RepID=UPI0036E9CC59
MRILVLTSSYEPLSGGAETYARSLCSGLTERGHEVVVVTDGSWLPDLPRERTEAAGRVLRLRDFVVRSEAKDKVRWRQMQYSVLTEIGEALAGKTFDIVHANSHETLVLATMIALDQDAALVCSLHEQNPQLEVFGIGRTRLSYQVLPVDVYFAASRFYEQRALDFGVPPSRLRLIYHGVRTGPEACGDRDRLRTELGLGPANPLVVLPGRVYTRKAQIDLARALPAVLAALPQVRVLLAGRVSDFSYQRRLAELLAANGTAHAVTLREDFGAADMPDVYAAADLVVQPSLEEGLGLAAIEAMAAARPVVATRVVGLTEVVTDGRDGLLVPPSNPELLADALIGLLTDPERTARLAEGARRTSEERFSQRAMVEETLDGYRQAVRHAAVRNAATASPTGGAS